MLAICLNWIYIFCTTACLGFGVGKLVESRLHYRIRHLDSIIGIGIVIVTVYAQVWSLFYKVGIAANVVMVLLCIFIVLLCHKEALTILQQKKRSSSKTCTIMFIAMTLIWSYCTSRGYMHYDSDLYHAQSIRWIEEYGIVKGLGNIHVRFAYNSSFFALSALYSMHYIFGQSLHCVNGFIALLLCVEIFRIRKVWKRKKFLPSDFARVAAAYYLTLIYQEITSPASDYAIMCVVFFIVIKWLAQLEEVNDSNNVTPYALLCVGGVFAVSLKLTAGLILLLVIKPACMLIRERNWKNIAIYLCLGLLVITPWIARTVIISGYLLYPFPELDIFSVDWKIPAQAAALDAAEIKTWGRGLNNAALVNMPITQWFPNWFHNMLPAIDKVIIIFDLCSLIMEFIYAVVTICRRKWERLDILLVWASVASSFLFWQISAPLLRYGYAYVLLLAVLTAWGIFAIIRVTLDRCFWKKRLSFDQVICLLLLIVVMIKIYSFVCFLSSSYQLPYYIKQREYGKYELDTFTIEGITFYYPLSGDRVGYDAFPAIQRKMDIKLRGEGLKDGFYQ